MSYGLYGLDILLKLTGEEKNLVTLKSGKKEIPRESLKKIAEYIEENHITLKKGDKNKKVK